MARRLTSRAARRPPLLEPGGLVLAFSAGAEAGEAEAVVNVP